jgi:hypothetical protein
VDGRYFINPPSGSPDTGNRDIVYEVLSPLYGNPSSPRVLYKTKDVFFKSEGFYTVMTSFKQDLLGRFVGTDEGEVTEYLGCEIIRNREVSTTEIVQFANTECVLKTFGMWDCNPVKKPLDANNRLSKSYCPEVVDPCTQTLP